MNEVSRLKAMWYFRGHLINKRKDEVAHWVARHLPHRVVMWVYIHVVAVATTGRYGNTNPTTLPALEALKRWEQVTR